MVRMQIVQASPSRLSSLLLLLVAMVSLSSCDGVLYHKFNTVGCEWHRGDTLSFVLCNPVFQESCCAADIELRCTKDYPYNDLWLYVDIMRRDSSFIYSDTLQFMIYEEGRIKGATAGLMYQTSSHLQVIVCVPYDTLTVRVVHIMDDDILPGVSDVGFRLSHCGRSRF